MAHEPSITSIEYEMYRAWNKEHDKQDLNYLAALKKEREKRKLAQREKELMSEQARRRKAAPHEERTHGKATRSPNHNPDNK